MERESEIRRVGMAFQLRTVSMLIVADISPRLGQPAWLGAGSHHLLRSPSDTPHPLRPERTPRWITRGIPTTGGHWMADTRVSSRRRMVCLP